MFNEASQVVFELFQWNVLLRRASGQASVIRSEPYYLCTSTTKVPCVDMYELP